MPSMNRRHSANPRPLRSSPLAGPALSSDGCDDGSDESHGKFKPSRISSSPDLTSPRTPSPSLFRRPGSSQGLAPEEAPPLPPLPENLPSTSQTPSKRSSIISLGSLRSKSKPKLNRQPSIEAPPTPSPPIPAWALQAAAAGPSLTIPRPAAPGPRRPKSLVGLPQPASGREVPPSMPRALSRDPAENWMTTTAYDTTPRFSRLGLGGAGVVMPVSARTVNKHLSRVGSSPSIKSTSERRGEAPPVPRVRPHSFIGTFTQFLANEGSPVAEGTPSVGDTRSSSSSSDSSSGSGSSKESVVTPTSTAELGPPAIASTSEVHLGATADSFLKRMKSISLRPSRSRANIGTDAKGHRGFLSSFRPDGTGGHGEVVPPLPVPSAAAQTRGRRVERNEVEISTKPGRRGTVRRLMRTLSTIGRKRSSP